MKTRKITYLQDGTVHVMRYMNRYGSMYEAEGKQRKLRIVEDGCYPRLMHVCADGRMRRIGAYPSFQLGKDWSASLQRQYKEGLQEVEAEDMREFYATSNGMMMGSVTMNSNLKD